MSSLLKFLGTVFLAALLLLGVGAAVYVYKGVALQKNAAAYVETNIPLIVQNWNPEEVVKRAAPEFLVPAVQEGLPVVFGQLSKLGSLKNLGKPQGGIVVADLQLAFRENRVHVGINSGQVQPVWAEFVTDADFDAGPAKVKVMLVRRSNDWRIMGFWVSPPAAAPGG
ncbi:hypothetical protein [Polaromonas sp. YR568]|uniref:hypothetical protein n=1 Tax=Polaromonas sp. YR568 TaxID=1855301 RepID=UPI00398BF209